MKRLFILVEGQTEESFVNNVLAEVLGPARLNTRAILLGPQGHKGGRTSYARVKRDIVYILKQDRAAYCSMMVDFYGLGPGYPGPPLPTDSPNLAKVQHLEQAIKDDICSQISDFRPDIRFIPYIQLHEYESLLFSDPIAFAQGINRPKLGLSFQGIRDMFDTPEDINNDPISAPSKRVLSICPSYSNLPQLQ